MGSFYMLNSWKTKLSLACVFSSLFVASHGFAAGMVPETSLLVINEDSMGGSINIKNTDTKPALLYTTINDLPDDKGTHVIVTQPVVRVEAGQTQQLRFVLQTDAPLKVEHMKRVIFEGIPPKSTEKNKVTINIRQDLPILIHPKGLPEVQDAWTKMTWNQTTKGLVLKNDTPYVVRFATQVELLPAHIAGRLDKTYILPGQSMDVHTDKPVSGIKQVKFVPASRYGIQVPSYTADVK